MVPQIPRIRIGDRILRTGHRIQLHYIVVVFRMKLAIRFLSAVERLLRWHRKDFSATLNNFRISPDTYDSPPKSLMSVSFFADVWCVLSNNTPAHSAHLSLFATVRATFPAM